MTTISPTAVADDLTTSTGSDPAVEALVKENLALVGHFVRQTLAKVPAHVNRDDLTSAGMLALVLAARSWSADRGVPFARFAAIRIRGALTDELRGMDWASRSVRSRARELDGVRTELAAALGRAPRTEEVAAASGMTVAEIDRADHDVARASVLRIDASPSTDTSESFELPDDPSVGPETLLLRREQIGYLHHAVGQLPDSMRVVVLGHFFEQRTMASIAAELGVTESRVSQLRSEALRLLHLGLTENNAGAAEATEQTAERRSAERRTARQAAFISAVGTGSTLSSRLARTSALGDALVGAQSA